MLDSEKLPVETVPLAPGVLDGLAGGAGLPLINGATTEKSVAPVCRMLPSAEDQEGGV